MASNQEAGNQRFDTEAATWDSNKKHVESCDMAVEAIKRHISAFGDGSSKNFDVLELGCGTGLISFKIAPLVRSLVGVDTSDGMIGAFNAKIAALENPDKANLAAVNTMLKEADDVHIQGAAAALAGRRGVSDPDGAVPYRFDLIISHLTFHHIADIPEILRVLYQCLKPGGKIAVTDYEDFGKEAIKFHPADKMEGVEHHGLKKEEMRQMIDGTGYNFVTVDTAYVLTKEVDAEEGKPAKEMDFPFLICVGQRN